MKKLLLLIFVQFFSNPFANGQTKGYLGVNLIQAPNLYGNIGISFISKVDKKSNISNRFVFCYSTYNGEYIQRDKFWLMYAREYLMGENDIKLSASPYVKFMFRKVNDPGDPNYFLSFVDNNKFTSISAPVGLILGLKYRRDESKIDWEMLAGGGLAPVLSYKTEYYPPDKVHLDIFIQLNILFKFKPQTEKINN